MQTTPKAATQTAYGATPIANAVKARINRGDHDAFWRDELRGVRRHAYVRNEIYINPALTDYAITLFRTSRINTANLQKEQR